jgi:hypothetical protein
MTASAAPSSSRTPFCCKSTKQSAPLPRASLPEHLGLGGRDDEAAVVFDGERCPVVAERPRCPHVFAALVIDHQISIGLHGKRDPALGGIALPEQLPAGVAPQFEIPRIAEAEGVVTPHRPDGIAAEFNGLKRQFSQCSTSPIRTAGKLPSETLSVE